MAEPTAVHEVPQDWYYRLVGSIKVHQTQKDMLVVYKWQLQRWLWSYEQIPKLQLLEPHVPPHHLCFSAPKSEFPRYKKRKKLH